MKLVLAILFIFSLVLCSSFLQSTMADPIDAKGSYCDNKCGERCGSAGVAKRCKKYCKLCCQKCNCVPSGTYGNKSQCPCYRDWLNSKGRPKCP